MTTYACYCRTNWWEDLPGDLLAEILGTLDVLTLCTARLVCNRFRQGSLSHVKALRLDFRALEQHPTVDLTQFTALTHLEVVGDNESRLDLLAHPKIARLVTHVRVEGICIQDVPKREQLAHLSALGKLRVLHLPVNAHEFELLPLGLERLCISNTIQVNASPLTRFSGLTGLRIDVASGALPSVASLTGLGNLRSLVLSMEPSDLESLSTFTMLSSLDLVISSDTRPNTLYQDLSHLTLLSHLRLGFSGGRLYTDARHQDLACIGHLTNLTCLDLQRVGLLGVGHPAAASSALAALSRLVSLGLLCLLAGLSLLPSLNVEKLQSLTLIDARGDFSVLFRATNLTSLELTGYVHLYEPLYGHYGALGAVFAMMSNLRSLKLIVRRGAGVIDGVLLSNVLQGVTYLTNLEYGGPYFTLGPDLAACASIPGLRSLSFNRVPGLTTAGIPALQAMSGLTRLILHGTGIRTEDLTPEVRAAFDVERLRYGWPGLQLECKVDTWWED